MRFATYCVTNATVFPTLSLPANSLIFRNGIFQTHGVDYDVINGTGFRFRSNQDGTPFLQNGDRLTVVTLP